MRDNNNEAAKIKLKLHVISYTQKGKVGVDPYNTPAPLTLVTYSYPTYMAVQKYFGSDIT